MAAALTNILEEITVHARGGDIAYEDLKDEKHQEFLRGMAWAAALLRGYELALPETGNPETDQQLIRIRDQLQHGYTQKLIQDCRGMLAGMMDEEFNI